jgi:hypothetical protein
MLETQWLWNLTGSVVGDFRVANCTNPAFYADVIMELFNEFRCYQTVSQRSRLLLHASSSEELKAISLVTTFPSIFAACSQTERGRCGTRRRRNWLRST